MRVPGGGGAGVDGLGGGGSGGEGVTWRGGVEYQEIRNQIAQVDLRYGFGGDGGEAGKAKAVRVILVRIANSYMNQRERADLMNKLASYDAL